MADINPSMPAINELNSTADPKILSALSSIVSTVNNLETANLADGAVTTVKLDSTSVTLAKLASEITDLICPVGSILDYSGSGDPVAAKWLLADGRELLIASYPVLYAAVGTTYGALTNGSGGVGTTYFRVPDLRGRVSAGPDTMGTAAGAASRMADLNTRGAGGGVSLTTLSTPQLPAHAHTGTTNPAGNHTHGGLTTMMNANYQHSHVRGVVNPNAAGGTVGFAMGGAVLASGSTEVTNTDHAHGINGQVDHDHPFTTGNTGSGSTVDIRQPYLVVNKIIRVA